MDKEIVYDWERLEIYDLTNRFARVVGLLLAQLPSQHHIHVHNLIGQAVVMSNAVAGANATGPPAKPERSVEQRRAWLLIGLCATRQAVELIMDVGKVTDWSAPDLAIGIELLSGIAKGFAADLDDLADTETKQQARHLA